MPTDLTDRSLAQTDRAIAVAADGIELVTAQQAEITYLCAENEQLGIEVGGLEIECDVLAEMHEEALAGLASCDATITGLRAALQGCVSAFDKVGWPVAINAAVAAARAALAGGKS